VCSSDLGSPGRHFAASVASASRIVGQKRRGILSFLEHSHIDERAAFAMLDGMVHAIDVIIGVGWLAFWLYWLTAAIGVKAGRTHGRPAGIRVVIAVVIIVLVRSRVFRGHMNHDAWLGGAGLALFAAGLGLAIWARLHLGRNWGSPMSEKQEPELVTSGPYKWIRNPIYTGIILAMIGSVLAVSLRWLVMAALLGGYFVYSAFMEQRFMAEQFPEQFAAYKCTTKMLIPFVY